ncbi:MAG: DUF2817 domain-containing protein [Ketobacter sp.]
MLTPLLSTQELSVFPASFDQARQALLAEVKQLDKLPGTAWTHRSLTYEGEGPAGERLSTEQIWVGEPDASRVLVLQSAVHGVEGHCGSAIQADLLRRLNRGRVQLPAGLAVLMIHAINPWGFAWSRRVDEQGIDVNRNFVDFERPLPVNPGYAQLAQDVLPVSGGLAAGEQALQAYLQEHGQRQYELALSGGQYQFEEGLFYGGRGKSQARLNLEAIINELDCGNRQVALLDLHTGLGPYGHGELICDHPIGSQGMLTAQRWFGDAATLPEAGDSCSVPKQGLVDYAWHEVMGKNSCYLTLEFGTYPLAELLRCLREDHLIRKPGQQPFTHPQSDVVRQQLLRQFYPAEVQWQTLVLLRARQAIQLACAGLFNDC